MMPPCSPLRPASVSCRPRASVSYEKTLKHEPSSVGTSSASSTPARHATRREFLQTSGRLAAAAALAKATTMTGVCSAAQPTGTRAGAWSRQELTKFMCELAGYVVAHHMRRDNSPMRGMVYEFYDPAAKQQGHGGGLDSMHDGAWFANACILAYRATGDEFYLATLRDWIMPFYITMLNHSDTLFPDRDGAFSDGQMLSPERAAACRGFVPYWWDDGHGVNFDARARKMTTAELQNKWGFTNTLPDRNDRSGKSAVTRMARAITWRWTSSRCWQTGGCSRATRRWPRPSTICTSNASINSKWTCRFSPSPTPPRTATNKKASDAGGYDIAPWPPESPLYKAMVQKNQVATAAVPRRSRRPLLTRPPPLIRVSSGTAKRLAADAYDCIRAGRTSGYWRQTPAARPRHCRPTAARKSGSRTANSARSPANCRTCWSVRGWAADTLGLRVEPALLRAFPDAWPVVGRAKYEPPLAGWSEPR